MNFCASLMLCECFPPHVVKNSFVLRLECFCRSFLQRENYSYRVTRTLNVKGEAVMHEEALILVSTGQTLMFQMPI